jgi:protoporphyrinogen oxidase
VERNGNPEFILSDSHPPSDRADSHENDTEAVARRKGLKVAILGGGISGLSTAHFLERRGLSSDVFEAAPASGGLCASETVDGFVADKAGGHIIYSTDKEVLSFVLGVLGEGGAVENKRETRIFHHGRYVTYPFENGLADLPAEHNFDCLKGYVEAAFARRNGATEPDDFHAWCAWRFGEGISRHFMWPYNEKIWNVDLRRMSTGWVRGRVPDAPIDDVLRSAIGIRTTGYGHQATFWYPRTGGFQTIVDRVRARLETTRVRTSTQCRTLKKTAAGWEVNGERYDRVISTIPLQELAKVLDGMPERIRDAFGKLGYTSLLTVFLALDHDRIPNLSWVYFPHAENGPQNRITFLSNYSPENAPKGKSSVMAEVTYIGQLPGTHESTANDVIAGLERCGILKKQDVRFSRTYDNRYAYILYEHGLEDRLELIRGWLREIGLPVVGRFGNYNYYNSDRCIRGAMDLAATF